MSTVPRPLQYQILVGCIFVDARPEFVRAGDVFRVLRADGSAYLAAARVLDCEDDGVYTAREDGTENGVVFEAVQQVTVLVAPAVDLGE